MKAKLGDLEEEIREGFSRRLRKKMTGVAHEVVGKRRYSARLPDGLEKEMLWNQINIVVVRSELDEEIEGREV